ncbi:MAG TPA: tetratricopeptide repeat protein [Legionellaceae bacterium]|nr:tetratricopeptide repeat protein [Legionellaceae bacterium]
MNDWLWRLIVIFLLTLMACTLMVWPLRKQRGIGFLLSVGLALVVCAYGYWGAWSAWMSHETSQLKQQKAQALLRTIKSPEVLIQHLQMHVAKHPKAARGWYFLGRLYASQHRWTDSLAAFSKAYALDPNDESTALNYAQGLWRSKNHVDQEKARNIVKQVLQRNPHQVDALAMLAVDAEIHAQWRAALDYWQRVLSLLPPQSAEANDIRKNIVRLRKK